jgi:hypothetical protein
MLDWPSSFRGDQLSVECIRDPLRDFVLQGKQIAHVAVEPIGP